MIQKTSVLAILHKYSFDSFYNEPFLYVSNENNGLLFSFTHPWYGYLKRVCFFETIDELENFVYRFWWYKKNGKKYQVTIELENYKEMESSIEFMMRGKKITTQDMKEMDFANFDESIDKKSQNRFKGFIRTAKILVMIIEEKIKFQKNTYLGVVDLMNEYNRQENEYLQLYNRYQKTSLPLNEILERALDEESNTSEISELMKQIDGLLEHQNMEKELISFIDSLWKTLKDLESDKNHLQNKYLLIKLPIDLEDVRKKKSYLESVINKKHSLFNNKKEDVLKGLNEIDESSEAKKIVKMDDYIDNEIKRINDKYAIIEDMDYVTLGDYLNEFDNLGIVMTQEYSENIVPESLVTMEEIVQQFTNIYENLSEEQKVSLNLYHSFLRPLCDEILNFSLNHGTNITYNELSTDAKKLCESSLEAFNLADNLLVRLKYFKSLNVNSISEFFSSIQKYMQTLDTIHEFILPSKLIVFGKSSPSELSNAYYHGSMKVLNAPFQTNDYTYIDVVTLSRGFMVLFFPFYFQLSEDLDEYHFLKILDNRFDIDFSLQKKVIDFKNSVIIEVSRMENATVVQNESYIEMKDLKKQSFDLYRKLDI